MTGSSCLGDRGRRGKRGEKKQKMSGVCGIMHWGTIVFHMNCVNLSDERYAELVVGVLYGMEGGGG